MLSWLRSSVQDRLLFLASLFAFSLAPGALQVGFCLAAALCHCRKERSIAFFPSLPPSNGRKAVRMLPCPCLPRAATVVGSSPKMTQEIFYLLQLCSVTLIIRECLSFVCITHSALRGKALRSSEIPCQDLPLSNQWIATDPLTCAPNQC